MFVINILLISLTYGSSTFEGGRAPECAKEGDAQETVAPLEEVGVQPEVVLPSALHEGATADVSPVGVSAGTSPDMNTESSGPIFSGDPSSLGSPVTTRIF